MYVLVLKPFFLFNINVAFIIVDAYISIRADTFNIINELFFVVNIIVIKSFFVIRVSELPCAKASGLPESSGTHLHTVFGM